MTPTQGVTFSLDPANRRVPSAVVTLRAFEFVLDFGDLAGGPDLSSPIELCGERVVGG
jgi:hypothetical protein